MEVDHKNSCTELLSLVIDGQATEQQNQELIAHMKQCEKCNEEYLLAQSIKKSLQSNLRTNTPPADLANAIQLGISETAPTK